MSTNVDTDDLPLVPGAVAGIAAWILGYVFTYLLAGSDLRNSGLNRFIEAFEGDPATYELVGWVFYNAHFVDIVYTGGIGASVLPANYIGGEDGFTALLYVLPPALLVGAGLAIGRSQGVTETNDGAIAGALAAIGYLVLSIVGVFLFEISAGGTTGNPDLVPAILLAGLVFPVVFGAIGGVIAANTAEEEPALRETS
ncbi:MAG: hypothetical protein ACI8UR_002041 [Natronomonas sp.]|jgi:hypothetical protein|uniref:hypothetical protein n=1 Tax=Natronomonas sp. TaxID=2184060 RepID=UPI00398959E5